MIRFEFPNACDADWNQMTKKEDKCRFCSLCENDVVDISKLEEEEAQKVMSDTTTCVKAEFNEQGQIRVRSGFSKALFFVSALTIGCTTEPEQISDQSTVNSGDVPENTTNEDEGSINATPQKDESLSNPKEDVTEIKSEEQSKESEKQKEPEKETKDNSEKEPEKQIKKSEDRPFVVGKPARNDAYKNPYKKKRKK